MSTDCIFCRIARQEISVELLYQDDTLVAFRDINPVAPVHILIVPKAHQSSILELTAADAEAMGRVVVVAAELARREGLADEGFRVVLNTGANAGQTVAHIHFHLIGGRELGWPPG